MLKERGFTIIEVLLSTVILSSVLAGAYALTNRAVRSNRTAIERTELVNQLKNQAELLKAARGDAATWSTLFGAGATQINPVLTPPPTTQPATCAPHAGSNPRFLRTNAAGVITAQRYQLTPVHQDPNPADFYEVWFETYQTAEYYDFHILGCWQGAGSQGLQQSGLVLRLTR